MPSKRVSLASCQRSAPESQFLAQEEIPPLLLLIHSSGRVARLLTIILPSSLVSSYPSPRDTWHPRFYPAMAFCQRYNLWWAIRPTSCAHPSLQPGIIRAMIPVELPIRIPLRAIARHPEPSVNMTRCRALHLSFLLRSRGSSGAWATRPIHRRAAAMRRVVPCAALLGPMARRVPLGHSLGPSRDVIRAWAHCPLEEVQNLGAFLTWTGGCLLFPIFGVVHVQVEATSWVQPLRERSAFGGRLALPHHRSA